MNSRRAGLCSAQRSRDAGWTRASQAGQLGVHVRVAEGKMLALEEDVSADEDEEVDIEALMVRWL